MSDVEINFEREGRQGLVAVGTYLRDAARRFGISFEDECSQVEGVHFCSVLVNEGSFVLSPLTAAETVYFDEHGQRANERLACQAKIVAEGELVIMTNEETKAEEVADTPGPGSEKYAKDFAELPLEKKIATLVQLEAIALGDTFSFIINSPFKVFEKLGDVMAEFGMKKEQSEKESVRPKEHTTAADETKASANAATQAAANGSSRENSE